MKSWPAAEGSSEDMGGGESVALRFESVRRARRGGAPEYTRAPGGYPPGEPARAAVLLAVSSRR